MRRRHYTAVNCRPGRRSPDFVVGYWQKTELTLGAGDVRRGGKRTSPSIQLELHIRIDSIDFRVRGTANVTCRGVLQEMRPSFGRPIRILFHRPADSP